MIGEIDEIEVWEKIHRERQWGTCPEPAMARFMMRRFGATTSPKWVLDLGCGAGAQTLWLAMHGFVVDAVDSSAAAVARAEKWVTRWAPYTSVTFHAADARGLPFHDGLFDAVVDVCTLQHVVDGQEKAINEAYRVLKSGGWLFSMMATDNHSLGAFGDMPTRPIVLNEPLPFRGCKTVESYRHTDRGLDIDHLVIEAQKE